jgi:hypothetical protein
MGKVKPHNIRLTGGGRKSPVPAHRHWANMAGLGETVDIVRQSLPVYDGLFHGVTSSIIIFNVL